MLEWLLDPGHRYVVGRGEDCDCRISQPGISRHHLLIDTSQWPWQLIDAGSKNGCRLEGHPLDQADLSTAAWLSLAGMPAHIDIGDARSAANWRQAGASKHETARQVTARLDPEQSGPDLLERTVRAFVELAECDSGALLLTDAGRRLKVVSSSGEPPPAISHSVIRQVLASEQPLVNSDVQTVAGLAEQASITAGRIRALACLPLILAGRVRGALYAESSQPGKLFTALDIELLEGLARQAAFVLAVSRMRRQIDQVRQRLPESADAIESGSELSSLLERILPAASR